MSRISRRFFDFGPYRLNADERVLLRDNEPLSLTPKAMDTLIVLVESCGHVIEKDELMKRVWPDTFVEEANLAVNISLLRKVLGARPNGGQYIETIPRRGYRFAAAVQESLDSKPSPLSPERGKSRLVGAGEEAEEAAGLARRFKAQPGQFPALEFDPAFKPPDTHYAKSGEFNIAYQVVGDAPLDLVFVMGWVSHLEYFWAEPAFARFLTGLASFSRLILFDKRGTGLSDRVPLKELPTLEQRMDDVRAVMEAVGSKRAALCGISEGGPMCSLFAATYPEKTSALVMIGTYAKRVWDPLYPWAPTKEQRQHFYEEIQRDWGGPVGLEERAPSVAHNPQFRQWWATYLRMGASPGAALALTLMNAEIDVRQVLPTIRVPTLIIHRSGDTCLRVEEGRYVADSIPGSKFVELPGEDHLPFVGDQDSILYEVEEFLTGVRHAPEPDRVLATVLIIFTSGQWDALLSYGKSVNEQMERFIAQSRKEIDWFRGREVEMTAKGLRAVFDGPARAIRCACAISEAARRIGIEVRAGLHTGECDIIGARISGLAVHLGEQVAASAQPGEIMVSSTVKDLVAGSGIGFDDRGLRLLDKVPGEWRLFAVEKGGPR